MTSKEALEELKQLCSVRGNLPKFPQLMFEKVEKDLDRLEKLEKIFSDRHICEIKARFNELECDADKCENCPLGIGDDICLKHTFEYKWQFQKERDKLKKIIQIIKTSVKDYLKDVKGIEIELSHLLFSYLTPEEYELLKEVLEDE